MPTIQATWVKTAGLLVPGDPNAKTRDQDPEMKTWVKVAVMEVAPQVPFHVGFISVFSPLPEWFSDDLNPDRPFRMRIGREDVRFVAMAHDWSTPLKLKLVRRTSIHNPDFAHVTLL